MRRSRGFTLVELMIVVAILGVLASLAIYGVARYLKHAKTAEATRCLAAIENGARQQYQRETPYLDGSDKFVHKFCPDAALTPAAVPVGAKIMVPSSEWNSEGWKCLKFTMNDPQYYAYQHLTNGLSGTDAYYTVIATGDLDGNGTKSMFELTGHGGPMGDAIREALRVLNEDE